MDPIRVYARSKLADACELACTDPKIINMEISVNNWVREQTPNAGSEASWENPKFRRRYKQRIMSILFNLGKNPDLVNLIKERKVKAQDIGGMPPEKLWPEGPHAKTMKQRRDVEATRELLKIKEDEAYEGLLTCPKCKSKKTSYYQMQTRSADGMDIRGLGDAIIRKFHEMGWLKDIPSIYNLPLDELRKMEGFGVKSVTNISEAIEKSKTQPLYRLINALGIRFVGETTAKTLAQSVSHLLDLGTMGKEDLQKIEDVGVKVAESIHQYFSNPANIDMLKRLEAEGLQLNSIKQQPVDGNLKGKSFLFTGTLYKMKRSEAEALVEANGGKILSGVSSKLDYLIVGEDAGSKLEKAKKIASIQILDEDGFIKLTH